MSSLAGRVATKLATDHVNQEIGKIKKKIGLGQPAAPYQVQIDWTDFNFPPLIRVIHFRLNELPSPYKETVRLFFISTFIVLPALLAYNTLINIIQSFYGLQALRILYSVLFAIISLPISILLFYKGYRGVAAEKSGLLWYKIVGCFLCVIWFLWFLLDFINFNGIIRMAKLFKNGYAFPGFLSLVEWILVGLYLAANIFLLVRIFLWKHEPCSDPNPPPPPQAKAQEISK